MVVGSVAANQQYSNLQVFISNPCCIFDSFLSCILYCSYRELIDQAQHHRCHHSIQVTHTRSIVRCKYMKSQGTNLLSFKFCVKENVFSAWFFTFLHTRTCKACYPCPYGNPQVLLSTLYEYTGPPGNSLVVTGGLGLKWIPVYSISLSLKW